MIKINSWKEIEENCFQFKHAIQDNNSVPYKRFSQFYHWYYFPQYNLFAPSKFLGYKGTTSINYKGEGTGTETTQILKKYFRKIARDIGEFQVYKTKLENFADLCHRRINIKTFTGTGGIYLPKTEYLEKEIKVTFELCKSVASDLKSQDKENYYSPSFEGAKKEKLISYYERNPIIRARAIAYHGVTCCVCGFNFERFYGKRGRNYIEVHHVIPISKFNKEIEVDPKSDMVVLCSNCHRMIHREVNHPLTIEELRNILTMQYIAASK